MLPFGLDCEAAVREVAREAARTPASLASGTLVLSCGSGVTLAGLLMGLPVHPRSVIGVSSGRSVANIRRCIESYVRLCCAVCLVPARMTYYDSPPIECPFPAHPNYDLKAWHLLVQEIGSFIDPVLFWNIGA